MDFMPTMAALAGAGDLSNLNLDGIDISPALFEGKALQARTLFWRHNYNLKAVRKGPWKLVKTPDITGLYNLDDKLADLAAWEASF
jgi:arylsulfatase A-like enzyme